MNSSRVTKKIEVGKRVKVIKPRTYSMPPVWEIAEGWEGIVTKIGITEDGFYYAYDLLGDDGVSVINYPGLSLMELIPGTERDVVMIIRNLLMASESEVEMAELNTAMRYVSQIDFSPFMMMYTLFHYGKTVGKKEERQRKKSLKTTLARQI
jgi:hypothetical protein